MQSTVKSNQVDLKKRDKKDRDNLDEKPIFPPVGFVYGSLFSPNCTLECETSNLSAGDKSAKWSYFWLHLCW